MQTKRHWPAVLMVALMLGGGVRAGSGDIVHGALGRKLDAYMQFMERLGCWGAVLVQKDGELVIQKGYGYADRKAGVRNSADTVFSVGSITKQFTAAAILKLEMQGKLSLNDPIHRYFEVPEDKRAIAVRHLLTHTAGLINYTGDDYERTSREEMARIALGAPLRFPPGERYAYSNAGYSLAAAIVEMAAGQGYEAYVREHLFEPAGIEWLGYRAPDWRQRTVSRMYRDDRDNGRLLDRAYPYWNLLGNGGMLATPGAMLRWHEALMGEAILDRAAKEKLYTPAQRDYALGWVVKDTPYGRRAGHNGGNDLGVSAMFHRYLDRDTVIYFSLNRKVGDLPLFFILRNGLTRLVFGETMPAPPAGAAAAMPEGWRQWLGDYRLSEGGLIQARDAGGVMTLAPGDQAALDALPQSLSDARCDQLSKRAGAIMTAWEKGDRQPFKAALSDSDAAERLSGFVADVIEDIGGLDRCDILGTVRDWWGDGDERATLIRLHGARDWMILRFHWNERGLRAIGGDAIPAPVSWVCLPMAGGGWRAYDPVSGGSFAVQFEKTDGSRQLTAVADTGRLKGVQR